MQDKYAGLALRVKMGSKADTEKLWNHVRRLVGMLSIRFYMRKQARCEFAGITPDDLIQEGYFAFLEAVEAYQPEKGYQFVTYLNYPLLKHFDALCGLRTAKGRKDPLTSARRLEERTLEDEDLTIGETIADETATQDFECVLNREYTASLHAALEETISHLTDIQQDVIRRRYGLNDGRVNTLAEIGKRWNVTPSYIREVEVKARRKLRHLANRKPLLPYREEIIQHYGYHGTGIQSFKNTWASSVERAILKLDELERKRED